MSGGLGQTAFQLSYQISPIIFSGGIASSIPGGLLPIIAITEGIAFVQSAFSGNVPTTLDDYFAQFSVIPGGTLIMNQVGQYPFANQQVAANAIISMPLNVSLLMTCPVNSPGGYTAKLATLTALQAAFSSHNSSGGLYNVATPSFIYTNLLMTAMTDMGSGDSKQPQITWQIDFQKPLVSLAGATAAYSSQISKLTSGLKVVNPTWSGLATSIGSQISGAFSSAVTGAQNLIGGTAVENYL